MHQNPIKIIRCISIGLLLVSLTGIAEPTQPANQANPEQTDKILVGNVEEGRYIARDRSFSFKLPITGDLHEVKKAIADSLSRGAQVIEITSRQESTDYRFDVSKVRPGNKDNSNFTQATAKTFDWYRRLIQRAWKAPVEQIVNEEFTWQGRRAAHAIFKQFADATSGPRYHIFYLADFNDNVVMLWANISLPEENMQEEDNIIIGSAGPALHAKQSFLSFRFE